MAVKKEATQTGNSINYFWGWENQLKALEKMEQQSLQTMEKQKQWIDSVNQQVSKWEDNTKKLTSEWKNVWSKELSKNSTEQASQNIAKWMDQWEDIGHKSQTIAYSPMKASMEILAKSHENIENVYKSTVQELQKNRLEVFKPFEGVMEQFKQMQQSTLKAFELPTK